MILKKLKLLLSVLRPSLTQLRRNRSTMTVFFLNGSSRLTISPLTLIPPRRNAAITLLRSSVSRLLMKRTWNSWTPSAEKTRTLMTRSRTLLTRLVRVAEPTTKLKRALSVSISRRRSSKQPWKRLKPLWNRRRTRSSEASWSSARSGRRSTDASRRRKRNSKTQG